VISSVIMRVFVSGKATSKRRSVEANGLRIIYIFRLVWPINQLTEVSWILWFSQIY